MADIDLGEVARSLASIGETRVAHDATLPAKTNKVIATLMPTFTTHADKVSHAKAFLALKGQIDAVTDTAADGTRVFKDGADFTKLREATKDLNVAFENDAAILQHFNEATDVLKTVAEKDVGVLKKLNGKLGGVMGMMHTEGLLETAKYNMTHLHDIAGNGRMPQVFGRVAGTALCAVGLQDAIFRGKTNNGEDRSVVTRFGQFAIFALGAAALILANKAHVKATPGV